MDEVTSGHMVGGRRLAPGNNKDVFSADMSVSQVEKAIRQAYRKGVVVKTQGDRVKISDPFGKKGKIDMWVNRATKEIETAYPKF
jgi:predicted secreted protein